MGAWVRVAGRRQGRTGTLEGQHADDDRTPVPTDTRRTVLLVAAATVAADLLTKWWASSALADGPVDLGWITLRLAENPGIAFSLGADAPSWMVATVTIAATVFIAVMVLRGVLRPAVAGGLLLGGGLGNLVDRLAGGTVTDFLDLGWFPSFNVADVALNVGVGLVLVVGLFGRHDDDHHGGDEDRPLVDDEATTGTA